MISLNISDPSLQSAVRNLLSLCSLSNADITFCDENSAADAVSSDELRSVIVLYKRGAYLYSDAHAKLSKLYGDLYRPMTVPLSYAEFCSAVLQLASMAAAASPPVSESPADSRDTRTVSISGCTLSYGELSVRLTEREMALFTCLRADCGRAVSREILKSEVWGNQTDEGTNIVDVYISYLRRKLKPLFGEGAVISVRGQGYMLNLPRE